MGNLHSSVAEINVFFTNLPLTYPIRHDLAASTPHDILIAQHIDHTRVGHFTIHDSAGKLIGTYPMTSYAADQTLAHLRVRKYSTITFLMK